MHEITTHATPIETIGDNSYMRDARGALIPIETIGTQDLLSDELIGKVFVYASELSAQIARFKRHTFDDLTAFQDLLAQEYRVARSEKWTGNYTLTSIDGRKKVVVAIAERIDFGPELQVAKLLVDECLIEWSADSSANLRTIVNRAFAVDQQGKINKAELFSILRLEIDDERWKRAMGAIRDSIRVTGTKEYVRFYERPTADAPWVPVVLDIPAL
jgi:hypothetical protein